MTYSIEVKKKIGEVIAGTFLKLGVSVNEEQTSNWVDSYVNSHNVSDSLTFSMVSDSMSALSKVEGVDNSVFSIIYNKFSSVGLLKEEIPSIINDVLKMGSSVSENYYIDKAKSGAYLSFAYC